MEKQTEKRSIQLERLLWSIAVPGFGQLLNRQFVKGVLLIGLEFVINVLANLNQVIVLSINGNIQTAIELTNYQWLMFYPCIYFFAIWDAVKEAGGGTKPFSYIPFVFSAYVATVGVVLSPVFRIAGYPFGPVWLPIIFSLLGMFIGMLIKQILNRKH